MFGQRRRRIGREEGGRRLVMEVVEREPKGGESVLNEEEEIGVFWVKKGRNPFTTTSSNSPRSLA